MAAVAMSEVEWAKVAACGERGRVDKLRKNRTLGGPFTQSPSSSLADRSQEWLRYWAVQAANPFRAGSNQNPMNCVLDTVVGFFIDNFPFWKVIAIGGPLGLAWSFAALWFAGRLRQNGIRTGYTRKVFHFLIFSTVASLQWRFGTAAVCLFGGMCTLVVFFAVWQGPGNMLYEATAREIVSPAISLIRFLGAQL